MFDKMDYEDWRVGTDCKTIGSWNLHQLLPRGLDFCVLLSSASGIVGLRGQANYASGNTYMDALARYRVAAGERAVSLDLGALLEDGLLAENPEFLNRVLGYGTLNGISRAYFYSVLDYYCNPDLPLLGPVKCQPILGLGSGAGTGLDGIGITQQALFCHLKDDTEGGGNAKRGIDQQEAWKDLFSIANSRVEATNVVSQALITKLQKTLSALQGDVDMYKPLSAYGVDSLLAVELRTWIANEFQADIPMFEISGGASLSTLSSLIASKSKVRHHIWS